MRRSVWISCLSCLVLFVLGRTSRRAVDAFYPQRILQTHHQHRQLFTMRRYSAPQTTDEQESPKAAMEARKANIQIENNLESSHTALKKLLAEEASVGESSLSSSSLSPPQPSIPWATLLSRTLDTLEDVVVHCRRLSHTTADESASDAMPHDRRQTIVVLGTGWAAHAMMKIADNFKLRMIVVSPANHFVFTPMLSSAAVGTVELRSMTEAVRSANPLIDDYIQGSAVDVDVDKKILTVELLENQQTRKGRQTNIESDETRLLQLPYDKLVVAVGCKVADNLVPGARDYAYRLKTSEDAHRLRMAIGECLERASQPSLRDLGHLDNWERKRRAAERRKHATFAIVGGGPTGVELAGELSDLLRDVTKPFLGSYSRLRDDANIVLIHGGKDLVPQFDQALRNHALQTLNNAGVDVRLDTRVVEVAENSLTIASRDGGEPETIHVAFTVWAAGTAPVPFVSKLLEKLPNEAKGNGGRVNVDQWMRCPTHTKQTFGSIIVLGDAAAFRDNQSYLPQTAQVAGQQGAFAARLIDRGYDLTTTPPRLFEDDWWLHLRGLKEADNFCFLNLGILAYLGSGEALSEIMIGDVPVFRYAGSASFCLWRSVYLVKQVATRNRVLVTYDWIKSSILGRDIMRV